MNYYRLDVMRQQESDYCMLQDFPEGMGLKTYKLCKGIALDPGDYPEDARIAMSDEDDGTKVPDIVGNTCRILIVSAVLKDSIVKVNKGKMEVFPVKILNHKKRVASASHFIINPIGALDVLDLKASDIEWLKKEVVEVRKYVLDPKKVKGAPALMRIEQTPDAYFISEAMLDDWRTIKPKPTNIGIQKLEYSK
jgi:hypothetical protein